jgi:hypothetical protein
MMKQVTVALTGWQLDWVMRQAKKRKVSISEVFRDMILKAKLADDGVKQD